MEDTLISIDSKYRDLNKYPNESKFTLNFEKIYKNIVSIKLISLELTNSINYISSFKNNNYITFYFPNILNDPIGVKILIDDTQLQNIDSIVSNFNSLLNIDLISISSERYFYIFYLYDTELSFDFNTISSPSILNTKLKLNSGWYTLYGLNLIIQNYIKTNYDARINFIKLNPNVSQINLDNGNFIQYSVTLNIFDRRYPNNIRNDILNETQFIQNNLLTNFETYKNYLYSYYVSDIINYIPSKNNSGKLDTLLNLYSSIYYFNKTNSVPINNCISYNLSINYNSNNLRTSFNNNLTNYYYTTDNWDTIIEFNSSLITIMDIPQFEININTNNVSFNNNIININSFKYPSIGYYLGFRTINNSSILSPNIYNSQLIITGSKNYNVLGDDYIFLRINDWGNFDFFNQILFSKIFLRSDLTSNNKTNNFINKEYVFSQLKTINRLDIELIDYLGNTVDLNGVDFSFTISLRTQTNIGQKQLFELQNKN